ncbi:hypothetical protein BLNAU_15043 [Blattamonas nauphoetae]|uniref:Uncharacterized protein n=1 Tax=Blattamonas nauphoetae TaxID=2049346 RepID=A0ABQ9XBY3_9EUKA|nr:hypothetical protein BLNAU_15043 [Blattamonas nauphoetae]
MSAQSSLNFVIKLLHRFTGSDFPPGAFHDAMLNRGNITPFVDCLCRLEIQLLAPKLLPISEVQNQFKRLHSSQMKVTFSLFVLTLFNYPGIKTFDPTNHRIVLLALAWTIGRLGLFSVIKQETQSQLAQNGDTPIQSFFSSKPLTPIRPATTLPKAQKSLSIIPLTNILLSQAQQIQQQLNAISRQEQSRTSESIQLLKLQEKKNRLVKITVPNSAGSSDTNINSLCILSPGELQVFRDEKESERKVKAMKSWVECTEILNKGDEAERGFWAWIDQVMDAEFGQQREFSASRDDSLPNPNTKQPHLREQDTQTPDEWDDVKGAVTKLGDSLHLVIQQIQTLSQTNVPAIMQQSLHTIDQKKKNYTIAQLAQHSTSKSKNQRSLRLISLDEALSGIVLNERDKTPHKSGISGRPAVARTVPFEPNFISSSLATLSQVPLQSRTGEMKASYIFTAFLNRSQNVVLTQSVRTMIDLSERTIVLKNEGQTSTMSVEWRNTEGKESLLRKKVWVRIEERDAERQREKEELERTRTEQRRRREEERERKRLADEAKLRDRDEELTDRERKKRQNYHAMVSKWFQPPFPDSRSDSN